MFGALVLAAFPLYGIGSAVLDRPLGLALVLVNSVVVAILGVLGFRLLRTSRRGVALGYLGARLVEGVLLGAGAALAAGADVASADTTGYLLAMMVLGVGSAPFCQAMGADRWLPFWLARWGLIGYVVLTIGAGIELATGNEVTFFFAVVGGLFEVALGAFLLRCGFRQSPAVGEVDTAPAPTFDEHVRAFRVHRAIAGTAVAICVAVNLAVNLSAGLADDLSAWWSGWVVVGCAIGLAAHALIVHLVDIDERGAPERPTATRSRVGRVLSVRGRRRVAID